MAGLERRTTSRPTTATRHAKTRAVGARRRRVPLGSRPLPGVRVDLGDVESDTARRILDYSVDVIAKHGEAALRIHELEAATGISIGSIYHFFGSREGLVEAAQAERYMESLRESVEAVAKVLEGCRSRDQLMTLLRRINREFGSPEGAIRRRTRLSVIGSALGRPSLERLVGEEQGRLLEDRLVEILRPFQEKGWIRRNVPLRELSSWLAGQWLGRALIEIGPSRADARAWTKVAEEALLAVICGVSPK